MPIHHSIRKLTFRMRLKPAPRTQSESNAILRALLKLGPISAFHVQHSNEPQDTVAGVVFAHNTKALDKLRSSRSEQTLEVTANANIPDPHTKDPFNIHGLKNRKPELPPRTFQCHLTPVTSEDRPEGRDSSGHILNELGKSEFSGSFTVDRNNIFGEILAKTDCPSGLIHGLMPKLKDEHRDHAGQARTVDSEDGHDLEDETVAQPRDESRKPHRSNILFAHVDLEQPEDVKDAGSSARYYDEFASLRNFSLMGTYRKASRERKVPVGK